MKKNRSLENKSLKQIEIIIKPCKIRPKEGVYMGFDVAIKNPSWKDIEACEYDIFIPYLTLDEFPEDKKLPGALLTAFTVLRLKPQFRVPPEAKDSFDKKFPSEANDLISFVTNTIPGYQLSKDEYSPLLTAWPDPTKDPNPEVYTYFGELLKRIFEGVGYEVVIEIPDYYFPVPAHMGFVVPAFGIGLQKKVKPEKIIEGYETSYIYISYEKPKSKIQVQYSFLDNIPEERLENIERTLKENLSPYGLKCLYLVLEGCAQNRRTNYFIFETNRALDVMGHTRNRKAVHDTKNKKRLARSLEELTKLNINFETRIPMPGQKGKEELTKFEAPIISLSGKFEKWEVNEGQPAETGKRIADGVLIYFHPEIYKFIEDRYTNIPHEYLKIDAGTRPHAIPLYSYIANQWRIGWHEHRGTIKQPMRQILDGSGLLKGFFKKRRNQQRDFIEGIKEELKWLKSEGWGWIKTVRFDTKNKLPLSHMVTIEMADNHPFKIRMTKQVKNN